MPDRSQCARLELLGGRTNGIVPFNTADNNANPKRPQVVTTVGTGRKIGEGI